MKEQTVYKSLKVTLDTWRELTRLSADTGEPRTRLIERLVREERERRKGGRSEGRFDTAQEP